jgi:DNA polymerase-3 subunit delta
MGSAGAVTVVVGKDDFLVQRTVVELLVQTGADAGSTAVEWVEATELEPGALAGLLMPSLFAEGRAVALRGAQELGKDVAADVIGWAKAPDPTVALFVLHTGGGRNKTLLPALRDAGASTVNVPEVKYPEQLRQFVQAEAQRCGGRIDSDAAEELVAVVGASLRELASACAQLVSDCGGHVDRAAVSLFHRGRAESTGFAIADRAVEGDAAGALELLRWGLSTGLAPVLVTSSLAGNLRSIATVSVDGGSMPGWKAKRARAWMRGWTPEDLAVAARAVADADAAVKGGAVDAAYAAERAVLAVAAGVRRR